MNESYDIVDKSDAERVKNDNDKINIENISFRYENTEPEVLKNVSLNVEQGETIALVWMSGGRKSTLISLIPRFYDVTSRAIKVDGQDIRDVQARSLRDNIGMVLQDNILFSESIAMNIRMGNPDASDDEVVAAA